jgi:hypothetical protein
VAKGCTEPRDDGRAAATAVPPRDLDESLGIWTHVPHGFARTDILRLIAERRPPPLASTAWSGRAACSWRRRRGRRALLFRAKARSLGSSGIKVSAGDLRAPTVRGPNLRGPNRQRRPAEFALNEGGGVGLTRGKPIRNSIQTSEKVGAAERLVDDTCLGSRRILVIRRSATLLVASNRAAGGERKVGKALPLSAKAGGPSRAIR